MSRRPAPAYVRFAAHRGFRPDFCEAHDPESKGIVEHLAGYAKRDLMVPQAPFTGLAAANAAAAAWCAEVNGAVHGEICAVPAGRLVIERELLAPLPSLQASIGRQVTRKVDRLSCVRFGSARCSVPVRLIGETVRLRTDDGRLLVIMTGTGEVVAEHVLVAPGGAPVRDEHYGGPRPAPRRAVRPRTAAEKEFCALGPAAEAFITGAAAAGNTRLGPELAELAAGAGTASPRPAGDALVLELPIPGRCRHHGRHPRQATHCSEEQIIVPARTAQAGLAAPQLRPAATAQPTQRRTGLFHSGLPHGSCSQIGTFCVSRSSPRYMTSPIRTRYGAFLGRFAASWSSFMVA
jgi:hypothetical protein